MINNQDLLAFDLNDKTTNQTLTTNLAGVPDLFVVTAQTFGTNDENLSASVTWLESL